MPLNIFDRRLLLRGEADADNNDAGGDDRGDSFEGDDTPDPDDEEQQRIVDEAKGASGKDEGKQAGEKKDEGKDERKDISVPKARFDEAVKKEREARLAAEKRLADAEAKVKEAEKGLDLEKIEGEISALEEKVDAALVAGDKAAAAAARKEIRAKMQQLATAEAVKQAAYATAVAVERVKYDATVTLLETQHPQMNPDSDQYNEELTNELIELKGAYEATGMGSTDALKKAAKYVFKDAPKQVEDEKTPEEKRAAEEKAEKDRKEAAEKAAKAKEEAIRRGQALKGKQPPAQQGRQPAKEDGAPNVSRMSDKDFDKLPDDEKRRLRGDFG